MLMRVNKNNESPQNACCKATVDVLMVDTKQNTHLHLTESNFIFVVIYTACSVTVNCIKREIAVTLGTVC